jgi:hypothetical protein
VNDLWHEHEVSTSGPPLLADDNVRHVYLGLGSRAPAQRAFVSMLGWVAEKLIDGALSGSPFFNREQGL